jgi:O-antigen/teichoic acid export membrane protein
LQADLLVAIFVGDHTGLLKSAASPKDEARRVKEKVIRGAFWSLIDTAGGQLLSFLAFLLLARLLTPADYGVVSLAMAVLFLPSLLLNEGFANALVQREDINDDHLTTAFWANLGLALFFTLIVYVGAHWVAEISGEPLVEPALKWLSLGLIATAVTSIGASIYRRRIQYSTFALRTLVAYISGAVVGIAMAALGCGVWSLIGSQLAQFVVGTAVIFAGLGWRPRLTLSIPALRDLYRFSSRTMVADALRFANERTDAIIIGGVLGAVPLGFYYMAQRLLATVNYVAISPVHSVMLPTLSRMQSDPQRLAYTYVSMTLTVALLWVPTVGGLGLISPHLVPLLFGHKWDPAVPVIEIVCITAVTQALTGPTSQVLLAVGKPAVNATLNMLQLPIMLVSFLVGVRFGIEGAAWAYTVSSVAVIPFHLIALRLSAMVPVGKMMTEYVSILAAGLLMAATVYAAGDILSSRLGDWSFVGQIALGALTYIAALSLMAPRRMKELLSIVSRTMPLKSRFAMR